ncbi:MAG: TatD family hydrolase [Cyclobacteriaceae bacterium]|nr:TatD family hydrolase [Cyclobacteriaceae bacterium]MCH8516680.1 TatD family hydrolase [Cyclobacteriaceae bacterium]
MVQLTDTHAHIYSEKLRADLSAYMEAAMEAGVHRIYMPNIDLPSIDAMMEVELKYPKQSFAMMGLHPCSVEKDFEKDLYVMEDWLNKRDFVGIGETGLDYYWDKTYIDQQKESLMIHIAWAKKYQRPLILHCRDSIDDTLEIIEEAATDDLRGIFHCFSGTKQQAERAIACGFHLGIGGVLTFKNSGLASEIKDLPLSKMVLETDSPYLAPTPHRSKVNQPAYVSIIAQKLADLMEMPLEELAKSTEEQSQAIFLKHG